MNLTNPDKSGFSVAIQCAVRSSNTAIRFPCLFSVQWHTNNQKVSIETAKYSPQAGKTGFNEDLVMRTQVAFDRAKRIFLKKETQVQLNLISKSRPDQSKLVGRVTIDLASILNEGLYAQPTEFPLQFCSVNGSLMMSFKVLEKTECDISLSQLEISCGEGMSLSSVLKLANASSSIKEKQRESADVATQNVPVSKNKVENQSLIKRQLSSSPHSQVYEDANQQQLPSKKISVPLTKETTQPQIQKVQQKPVTRSFKNITSIKESIMTKKSEVTEDLSQQITDTKDESKKSSFKKLGSISSEEGKINESGRMSEDISKQKLQNDRLKMQNERYKQQAQMYRLQLQKSKQEYELIKMQLKQKKSNAEQNASDANHLKSQTAKLREDLLKSRQESVSLTLKLAQLREAHNKSVLQTSINQRELSKFQGVNQRLQSLLHSNEQLQNHINTLQVDLADYQSRCQQLQLQKTDLKSTLNNLDQMHQEALSKCTQNEQMLSENKGSFETEMRVLKEHLKQETKQKMELQFQIQQLNEEIERLMSVASEFDEARHSWEITEGINNDDKELKNARLKELEENLITLDERVRWLQGQNELLTQNCRKNREDYLKIKSEKEIHGETSQEEMRRYQQTVQQLKDQNYALQEQVANLQQLASRLQQQCDELKSGNDFQTQNILQLQANLSEVALKNHQLQELVININQLRDRQRQENTNKERDYVIKIAELQGNNQQLEELVQANAERVNVIEDELKGRQNLIMRLQEGLRTQVERSQQLNNRVMHFLQKEERMKETVILLELQSKKVTDLLSEQQAKEIESQETIRQLQKANSQLLFSLEESVHYVKGLQQLIKANENGSNTKIATLTKEIEKKTSQISQNKLTIQTKTARIKAIEEQFGQFQAQAKQTTTNSQHALQQLKKKNTDLESYIAELEDALTERSSKVQQLQNQLTAKHNEVNQYHSAIDKQTLQFEKMCEQLKEVQLNHQKQVQDAQQRYLDISNKYQELQIVLSNKEKQFNDNLSQNEQQIKELKDNLDAISKQNTTLAVTTYKNEIKQKNEEIKKLQTELKSANAEAVKVPNLERTLKIRNIELNSLKFKGKNDGYEGNELLRLKDQEISALTAERQRFLDSQAELQGLREKSQALATELELIEEQKFNIESLSNERALLLEQARDENKKLMDEITIIGERNGELEKTLQQLLSKQPQGGSSRGETALRAELTLLKGQLKEFQQMKKKVYDLQQGRKKMQEDIDLKEEEHMIALLDQQLKNNKNDSIKSNESLKKSLTMGNNNSKQNPNLASTYKSLKEIIDQRRKCQDGQKLIQLIQSILSQDEKKGSIILGKSRELSKEFQRLKIQMLKSEGKGGQQKLKLMNLFKGYEALLAEVVRLSESVHY